MTIAYQRRFHLRCRVLAGVLVCAPIGIACAGQAQAPLAPPAPQVLLAAPPPGAAFQQTVQQQQLRDQLQQRQLQQQLHQEVSNTGKRAFVGHRQALQQIDQANRAQQQQDRASQQDLLDRYRDAATLPQGAPVILPAPAPAHSGG
ncbi:MAG: hypothetical protein EPN74_13030 [Rhodanobacter sp.]|nr:MAG: hypothetical protein EPN74_13030 [Rhodanobacter sp.]